MQGLVITKRIKEYIITANQEAPDIDLERPVRDSVDKLAQVMTVLKKTN